MNNIIIFSNYFMDSVISLVETTHLNVGIYGVSSYVDCLRYVDTTPNLLGVVSVDYIVTRKTKKFYSTLIDKLDTIAHSAERTLALSVLYRSQYIYKYLVTSKSEALTIMCSKYNKLNEEILRLDGIVPIILNTLGVYKEQKINHFLLTSEEEEVENRNQLIDALVYLISENPYEPIVTLYLNKYPEIRDIYNYLKGEDISIDNKYKGTFLEVFCGYIKEKNK